MEEPLASWLTKNFTPESNHVPLRSFVPTEESAPLLSAGRRRDPLRRTWSDGRLRTRLASLRAAYLAQ